MTCAGKLDQGQPGKYPYQCCSSVGLLMSLVVIWDLEQTRLHNILDPGQELGSVSEDDVLVKVARVLAVLGAKREGHDSAEAPAPALEDVETAAGVA